MNPQDDSENTDSKQMSPEKLIEYHKALAAIDSIPNENPGDNFSGADHDAELYKSP